MNSISWFLYFAAAFDNSGAVLGPLLFVTFMTAIAATAGRVAVFIAAKSNVKECIEFQPTMRSLFRIALTAWAVAAVLYVAIPDKKTVYAIAASQVGERVAKSDAVQGLAADATKALQVWINAQLEKK